MSDINSEADKQLEAVEVHVSSPVDATGAEQPAQPAEVTSLLLPPLYLPLESPQDQPEMEVTYVQCNNQYMIESDDESPIMLLQPDNVWKPLTRALAAANGINVSTYVTMPSHCMLMAVDGEGRQFWLNPSQLPTPIVCTKNTELSVSAENISPNVRGGRKRKSGAGCPAESAQGKHAKCTLEAEVASTTNTPTPMASIFDSFEKSMFGPKVIVQPAHQKWELPMGDRGTGLSQLAETANRSSTRSDLSRLSCRYPVRLSAGRVLARGVQTHCQGSRITASGSNKAEQFTRAKAAAKAKNEADAAAADAIAKFKAKIKAEVRDWKASIQSTVAKKANTEAQAIAEFSADQIKAAIKLKAALNAQAAAKAANRKAQAIAESLAAEDKTATETDKKKTQTVAERKDALTAVAATIKAQCINETLTAADTPAATEAQAVAKPIIADIIAAVEVKVTDEIGSTTLEAKRAVKKAELKAANNTQAICKAPVKAKTAAIPAATKASIRNMKASVVQAPAKAQTKTAAVRACRSRRRC